MENIIEAIKQAFEWYFSTALPKDTALAFYNTIKDILLPLMQEYIAVIFG